MKRFLLVAVFLLGALTQASAANCFWGGGTGNWNDAAHWFAATNSAGGACAGPGGLPSTGDTATMDVNSCASACTITINQAVTVQAWTWGACTNGCTIDNSGNHNVTVTVTPWFNGTGTGTRTFTAGTGIYSVTAATASVTWNMATTTNCTCSFSSATINMNNTGAAGVQGARFANGGLTYGTINFTSANAAGFSLIGTAWSIGTFNIVAPNTIFFPAAITTTITSALTVTGSSSTAPVLLVSNSAELTTTIARSGATIGTLDWVSARGITVTGGTISGTNGRDFGGNTAFAITPPTAGGGAPPFF